MLFLAALVVFSACDNWNIPVKDRMEFYASVVPVSSWEELREQAEESDAAVLALTHDIVLTEDNDPAIKVTRTLTITAFEGTRTISRGRDTATAFLSELFDVSGGGDLTLGHPQGGTLILDGGAIWNDADLSANTGVEAGSPLIVVGNARLTIRDGAILRNNYTNSSAGGGIHMFSNSSGSYGAELIITGGTISGNRADSSDGGGGVYVVGNDSAKIARMTITGGTISGNRAGVDGSGGHGGGVYVFGDGGSAEFTMSGGAIISENTADGHGGGVYIYGKDNGSATLTMAGDAIISLNEATSGGGVYVSSEVGSSAELTMKGGTISGNTATGGGGGMYVSGGNFTLSGTAVVSDNKASSSGGIRFEGSGTFSMEGGTVSGNTSSSGGGGVGIGGGTFTMSGGTISGNKATGAGTWGGGVCIWTGSFTMTGGTISGNTISAGMGGGVFIQQTDFTMQGGTIAGNSAAMGGGVFVYLADFAKTGGIIRGMYREGDIPNLETEAPNTANSDADGHAVRLNDGKTRNSTAGLGVPLEADDGLFVGGGWE